MKRRKTDIETLIDAMRILARDVQCDDGVANSAILEAADRMDSFRKFIEHIRDNYDCDGYAHKYGTSCRSCEAAYLIPVEREEDA